MYHIRTGSSLGGIISVCIYSASRSNNFIKSAIGPFVTVPSRSRRSTVGLEQPNSPAKSLWVKPNFLRSIFTSSALTVSFIANFFSSIFALLHTFISIFIIVLFFLVSIKIIILMIFYWYFVINMMTFNFVIRDYTIFKLMFKLPSQLFYIVI